MMGSSTRKLMYENVIRKRATRPKDLVFDMPDPWIDRFFHDDPDAQFTRRSIRQTLHIVDHVRTCVDIRRSTVDLDFSCFNSMAGAQQPEKIRQISKIESALFFVE
jgi:hypothetical protein